jgi:hypothetical protein
MDYVTSSLKAPTGPAVLPNEARRALKGFTRSKRSAQFLKGPKGAYRAPMVPRQPEGPRTSQGSP